MTIVEGRLGSGHDVEVDLGYITNVFVVPRVHSTGIRKGVGKFRLDQVRLG